MVEDVKVVGIEDLNESLKALIKKYPDRAGECLRKEGYRTRGQIVKSARENTDTASKSPKSLGKVGSYRVSQVKGYGVNQYVEISARSPHFHLVERGHVIKQPFSYSYKRKDTGKIVKFKWKDGGQIKGRVAGRFFLKKAEEAEAERFPEFVDEMLDKLLNEVGL